MRILLIYACYLEPCSSHQLDCDQSIKIIPQELCIIESIGAKPWDADHSHSALSSNNAELSGE